MALSRGLSSSTRCYLDSDLDPRRSNPVLDGPPPRPSTTDVLPFSVAAIMAKDGWRSSRTRRMGSNPNDDPDMSSSRSRLPESGISVSGGSSSKPTIMTSASSFTVDVILNCGRRKSTEKEEEEKPAEDNSFELTRNDDVDDDDDEDVEHVTDSSVEPEVARSSDESSNSGDEWSPDDISGVPETGDRSPSPRPASPSPQSRRLPAQEATSLPVGGLTTTTISPVAKWPCRSIGFPWLDSSNFHSSIAARECVYIPYIIIYTYTCIYIPCV